MQIQTFQSHLQSHLQDSEARNTPLKKTCYHRRKWFHGLVEQRQLGEEHMNPSITAQAGNSNSRFPRLFTLNEKPPNSVEAREIPSNRETNLLRPRSALSEEQRTRRSFKRAPTSHLPALLPAPSSDPTCSRDRSTGRTRPTAKRETRRNPSNTSSLHCFPLSHTTLQAQINDQFIGYCSRQ